MIHGIPQIPQPVNEPVRSYAPGTRERASLQAALRELAANPVEIPAVIGGERVFTGRKREIRAPHDHSLLLGWYHEADATLARQAITAALGARRAWAETHWLDRAMVLLRAAELLAGPRRDSANAATMLGQSKTCFQAEIDSACELVDFWRYNPWFMRRLYEQQPLCSPGVFNYTEQRPLEGFVFAITPFNFTSIGGNLPTAPVLMGNVCVWKPASTAVLSSWHLMMILEEAGLPPGVINFLPGPGAALGEVVLSHPDLSGVHFTGSTSTFAQIWKTIGADILRYRTYPRIVGETGGKDFIFVHASADPEQAVAAIVRGAYEYQGQKCSAASRLYVPESLWPELRGRLIEEISAIPMGDVADFRNFMGAVIDAKSYKNISDYIHYAKSSPDLEILAGGGCDDSRGYFIQPTLVLSRQPKSRLMIEEIFGPVLTVFVYPGARYEEALALCDETSPYALTGAIFARERLAIRQAFVALRNAAGNFYVNDKPTGAVVGQQPFGGARASGTNDKAGSELNLLRWVSTRAIKENLNPPRNYRYPHMAPDE